MLCMVYFLSLYWCVIFCFAFFGGDYENHWKIKSYPENITYGGTVTKLAENNYLFESRTNPFCLTSHVRCNKALVSYRNYRKPIEGKVVVFELDFKIEKYNFTNSPGWWVLFQDWLPVEPKNRKGNRPISTIEVKSYGQKLYIRHKDSAFQWGTDPTRIKQINNGQIQININQPYHLRIEITESTLPQMGGMSLFVDDKLISSAKYQTKSATQWRENVQEFGIYHDKAFDSDRLAKNKVIFSIKNLVKSEHQ